MRIRDFDKRTDSKEIRNCIVELQDYERGLDPRMPAGSEIADAYIAEMFDRCKEYHGKILVADADGEIAGFTSVWTKVQSKELEDGDMEYGVVSDLVVRERFRNRGIGRQLLEAAEAYARACRVQWLRIGVLANNRAARELYASMGFSGYQVLLEKRLAVLGGDA